jgi:hypothetical protein
VDWVHLAQDKDQRLALVNMVISFGFHKMQVIPCLHTKLLASQGLCYRELVGWLVS